MTQGIISIRRNGAMLYKVVTGHDGMNARFVLDAIHERYGPRGGQPPIGVPTPEELREICVSNGFGCRLCLIILEANPEKWNEPIIHHGIEEPEWDDEGKARYLDTFHVPQFNPRWRYGTAEYVEIIDL